MSKILEELQARAAEAKKKYDEAVIAFQSAQQTQVQAQQNLNVWNLAVQIETREEQQKQAAASEKQTELPLPVATVQTTQAISEDEIADAVSEAVNKTNIVRNLLREHPAGMTAVDIWKQVSERFKHRPYLYSVLKRLRDREEVLLRRGKYLLRIAPKIEEVKAQESVVH